MKQLKTLNLNGIQRNKPQGSAEACDELINMRFHNGAWEPIGQKKTLFGVDQVEYPDPTYEPVLIHKLELGLNWIGYDAANKIVKWYDPAAPGTVHQSLIALASDETFEGMQFLKNFLLIATDKALYRFIFKDNTYLPIKLTGMESQFTTVVSDVFSDHTLQTEQATVPYTDPNAVEELLGHYYKLLAELSDKELINGGMFLRTTIKLYDGSEILHTLPKYFSTGDLNINMHIENVNLGLHEVSAYLFIDLASATGMAAQTNFVEEFVGQFAQYKTFIQSIVLYGSRVQPLFDVSNMYLTAATLKTYYTAAGNTTHLFDGISVNTFCPINPAFKTGIADSDEWYQIGEVAFSSLLPVDHEGTTIYEGDFVMDIRNYYSNFATHKRIEVDNFSHHELTGGVSYMYNNRINLGDTIQDIGLPDTYEGFVLPTISPKIGVDGYVYSFSWPVLIQITLDTTNGKKYVSKSSTMAVYVKSSAPSYCAVFLPGLIGYFDNRATEVSIFIKPVATWLLLTRQPLESSLFGNYSYYTPKNFIVDMASGQVDGNFISYPISFYLSDLVAEEPKTDDRIILDHNRVQPSQVNNPFVFPVKDSEQVSSSGTVLALGTNTEDVSTGQQGQFPLYVFTSEGIWALSIGTGAVYITNKSPLSGEVIRDKYSKLDLSFGIAYITTEGLKIISGKEVADISDPLEGLPDPYLASNLNVQYFLNHANLVQLLSCIDQVPIKVYMNGAKLGFNKGYDRAEIVLNNPAYSYHYIYENVTHSWTKVSGSIGQFVPNYPELYAVNSDSNMLVNLSVEVPGPVQCMFLTRAHTLAMGDTFKKLRRTFFRCHLNTTDENFAAGYIFKSDNLKEWSLVTGNDRNTGEVQDIWITHSMNSARYYVFMFVGELDVDAMNTVNQFKTIECEFEDRMSGKLR